MKKSRFLVLISLLICFLLPFNAYAKTYNEITTSYLEEKDVKSDYSVTLLESEPEKYSIDCFDVNDNNNIVLVTENSSKLYLSVYDKKL